MNFPNDCLVYIYGHACEHDLHSVGYSYDHVYEAYTGLDRETHLPIHRDRSRISISQLRWALTPFSNPHGDSYSLACKDFDTILQETPSELYWDMTPTQLYTHQLNQFDWHQVLAEAHPSALFEPEGFYDELYKPVSGIVERDTWGLSIQKTL